MLKKIALILLGLIIVSIVIFFLGPRVKAVQTIQALDLPKDLDKYLKTSETKFKDITDGAEKRIFWHHKDKRQTEWSLVYIHGFSATRQESSPVSEQLAKELGANLFCTRLAGHGRPSEFLGKSTANQWLNDMNEAYEIGRRIGKKVIVFGLSTGATLALWMAANKKPKNLAAVLTLAPNFAPANKSARILLMPWGLQIASLIAGKEHQWKAANARQEKYWTTRYPIQAVGQMMALVDLLKKTDLSQLTTPTLVMYHNKDKVVSTKEIEKRFPQIGAKHKEKIVLKDLKCLSGHVVAGDILCPKMNKPIIKMILKFLKPLRTTKQTAPTKAREKTSSAQKEPSPRPEGKTAQPKDR